MQLCCAAVCPCNCAVRQLAEADVPASSMPVPACCQGAYLCECAIRQLAHVDVWAGSVPTQLCCEYAGKQCTCARAAGQPARVDVAAGMCRMGRMPPRGQLALCTLWQAVVW